MPTPYALLSMHTEVRQLWRTLECSLYKNWLVRESAVVASCWKVFSHCESCLLVAESDYDLHEIFYAQGIPHMGNQMSIYPVSIGYSLTLGHQGSALSRIGVTFAVGGIIGAFAQRNDAHHVVRKATP